MVGVAGKSKGCTTCRRRKIRCGQEQPHCLNCIRSRRPCEGYERYPVFVNRTPEGLQRRRPLEEAKPDMDVYETTAIAHASPNRDQISASQGTFVAPLIAGPSSAPAVWSAGFISWFWENYSPSSTETSTSTPTKDLLWLYHAINIPQPTRTLHQALLALSMVRFGRANNNQALVIEGQSIYGQGLSLVQGALYDSARMKDDETLAAVRAMALYELFEATSNTELSWHQQISGLGVLILSRGPANYSTPLARAVLEEFRYPLMIDSIMLRKASPMAESTWLTRPWADSAKESDQILYDHGFTLAVILNRVEGLAETAGEGPSRSRFDLLVGIMQSSVQLNHALDEFFYAHCSNTRLLSIGNGGIPEPVNSGSQHPLDLSNIHTEGLVMTWWAIKLCLANVGHNLALKASGIVPNLPPPARPSLSALCEQLEAFSNNAARNVIGHSVLRSAPWLLDESCGRYGPSRAIFPLAITVFQFRDSEAELAIGKDLLRQISSRKGFNFAGGVKAKEVPIPFQ